MVHILCPQASHIVIPNSFACASALLVCTMAPWLHTLCIYNIGSRHCLHRHGNSRALVDTNQEPIIISYRSICTSALNWLAWLLVHSLDSLVPRPGHEAQYSLDSVDLLAILKFVEQC